MPDIAKPVVVEVDGMLQIARWHELRLAHCAGPRSGHRLCVDITAGHDRERVEQLAPEKFGAPWLPRERRERLKHRIRAGERAVMRLETPDSEQDGWRDAVGRLNAEK